MIQPLRKTVILSSALLVLLACAWQGLASGTGAAGDGQESEAQRQVESEGMAREKHARKQFAALLPSVVTTPRQAAAAALLLQIDEDRRADRERWLAYARERGGNDALVQMVLGSQVLRDHRGRKQLDRGALARMQALEPDNAHVWLLTLNLEDDQPGAAREALRRAGQAAHYDNRWRELERELYQLLQHWPRSARDEAAMIDAHGFSDTAFMRARGTMMAFWIPGYARLTETCRQPEDEVAIDCLRVAALLMGDQGNMIERQIGIAILERLEKDPSRLAELGEIRRTHLWRNHVLYEQSSKRHGDPWLRSPEDVAYLMERGEWAVQLRALEREGLPTSPPAGWKHPYAGE